MRAIQVTSVGGPEVLVSADLPDPEPAAGQVGISVVAAGLNYIDTYHRTGLYPKSLPFIPGLEGAGTVIALGEGVTNLQLGDRVAWTSGPGSYAEQAAIDAAQVVAVPAGIELEKAAAVMLQGLTAHYLSSSTHRLTPGDRCLVHAGAGGVGLLLIQMAKQAGAEVYTTVSSPQKEALARQAGADHVFGYEDFVDDIETTAGSRPLDVVYDGVGAATFEPGLRLLRPRGLMVLYGQASGPVPPIDLQVLSRNGSLFVTRPTLFDHIASRQNLEERAAAVFRAMERRQLEVRIGQTWPLAQAADAHRALQSRATTGKTLLIP